MSLSLRKKMMRYRLTTRWTMLSTKLMWKRTHLMMTKSLLGLMQ
jgi:hypothetical protein